MKKAFSLLVCCLLPLILSGCSNLAVSSSATSSFSSSGNESSSEISSSRSGESGSSTASEVVSYPIPAGVNAYGDAELYVNGVKVAMYAVMVNLAQTWNGLAPDRIASGAVILQMKGSALFTVKAVSYDLSSFYSYTKIRPIGRGVTPSFDLADNSFSFTINQPGQYTIEPCGDRQRTIHLFVDDLEKAPTMDPSSPLYFGPGLHDATTDPRLSSGSVISLSSNETVYLDYGAVVRGRFVAYGQNGISVVGGGVIDGSTFSRIAGQVSGNTSFVPIDFQNCASISFKDFAIFDPAGWAVNWYYDSSSAIEGLKIITSRSNGDGISIQSCHDIKVSGCFVRTWDDSLVVKNYPQWNNFSLQGATSNIHFDHCIIWTDLAQSMEIGYETVGEEMENITFSDITVLHAYHKPVISIHNGNNARIQNVTYENITVEAAMMGNGDAGNNNQLIQFAVAYNSTWSDQYGSTPLGSISFVNVNNLKVIDGNENEPIAITGCLDTRSAYSGSTHYVSDVTLTDVSILGKTIDADYPYFTKNEYVTAATITSTGKAITGASLD